MAAVFTALPLRGEGDSLLYQSAWGTVIVDGGKRKREAAQLLRRPILWPTILLCTHGDLDHIGGIRKILRTVEVNEVWLPADWALFLIAMARGLNLSEVIREFRHRVRDMRRALGASKREQIDNPRQQLEDFPAEVLVKARPEQSEAEEEVAIDLDEIVRGARAVLEQGHLSTTRGAIGTARAIAEVVAAAIDNSGQPNIRWFSYDAATSHVQVGRNKRVWREVQAGCRGWFTLVNALEVGRVPLTRVPSPAMAGWFLALTIVNHRSLVAFGWSGALMCSDSGFEFVSAGVEPPPNPWMATAPHHGSDEPANVSVYPLYSPHTWWVRSGANPGLERPGNTWRKLKCVRFCTQCDGDAAPSEVSIGLGSHGCFVCYPFRNLCKCP